MSDLVKNHIVVFLTTWLKCALNSLFFCYIVNSVILYCIYSDLLFKDVPYLLTIFLNFE